MVAESFVPVNQQTSVLYCWIFHSRNILFYSVNPNDFLKSYACIADPIDFKLTLSFFLFSGQMFLMDRFFDGAFLTFGLEVIAFAEQDQEDRLDPLIYVFPRMTKCTFHKFGTSGEVEKHDALCLLPLNIVNEVCLFVCLFACLFLSFFFV